MGTDLGFMLPIGGAITIAYFALTSEEQREVILLGSWGLMFASAAFFAIKALWTLVPW